MQNLVRNNKLKKRFSLQLKTSSRWYWDKRCDQGAWPWSRTSSPQKYPSSRCWCQLFWALSIGHEGMSTWAAVCSQWIHNCWQLHRGIWCALKFTLSSVSLKDNVCTQEFVSCHCKGYCIDKTCKSRSKNIKCNFRCHSNSSFKNKRVRHCSLCLRYMYFLSINYWNYKQFI